MEAGVGSTPERAAMPILRLQVRPEDWERKDWRESFEADLKKTGWFIQSIEPPSPERPEYVYLLVLKRRVRWSSGPMPDSAPSAMRGGWGRSVGV